MGTRSAVFDGFGPSCARVPHEWQRLGTWTVYCRRCYHHHWRACRCPACAPAPPSRPKRPTPVAGSGRTEAKQSDGQQCLLPFLETSA
jgi:hypothetical protein